MHTHSYHHRGFPLELSVTLAVISAAESQAQFYSDVSVFARATGSDWVVTGDKLETVIIKHPVKSGLILELSVTLADISAAKVQAQF